MSQFIAGSGDAELQSQSESIAFDDIGNGASEEVQSAALFVETLTTETGNNMIFDTPIPTGLLIIALAVIALVGITAMAILWYFRSRGSNTVSTYEYYPTPSAQEGYYSSPQDYFASYDQINDNDSFAAQPSTPEWSGFEVDEEMTRPVRLPSFYTTAPAYLTYVNGGEHLPERLPLEPHEPIRIGRKRAFCEQVIDDRRISRLHATITSVDGEFYIKDEGSSGGTFVNRRKLGAMDNHMLNNNDIINFNEVEYRFEITDAEEQAQTDPTSSGFDQSYESVSSDG